MALDVISFTDTLTQEFGPEAVSINIGLTGNTRQVERTTAEVVMVRRDGRYVTAGWFDNGPYPSNFAIVTPSEGATTSHERTMSEQSPDSNSVLHLDEDNWLYMEGLDSWPSRLLKHRLEIPGDKEDQRIMREIISGAVLGARILNSFNASRFMSGRLSLEQRNQEGRALLRYGVGFLGEITPDLIEKASEENDRPRGVLKYAKRMNVLPLSGVSFPYVDLEAARADAAQNTPVSA